jgi:hypothetical protein
MVAFKTNRDLARKSESLVREMQKRMAHSTHLQSQKTYRGVSKDATHPSLGSKCLSSVQSFLALT